VQLINTLDFIISKLLTFVTNMCYTTIYSLNALLETSQQYVH